MLWSSWKPAMNPSRAEYWYGDSSAWYVIIKRHNEKTSRARQHHTRERDPGQKTPCDLPLKPTKLFFYYFFWPAKQAHLTWQRSDDKISQDLILNTLSASRHIILIHPTSILYFPPTRISLNHHIIYINTISEICNIFESVFTIIKLKHHQ